MNWKRVLKSWYFWSAMIFIVILSVIWETWNSVNVDMVGLPKFETGGISKVLADQNGVMIAGAILVGIVAVYLLRKILGKILIVGIILTLAFIGYREWDWVEDARHETVRILKNGIAKSVFIGKVEDLPKIIDTSDFPRAYYRLKVRPDPGKESYWGDCNDGKSFRGHAVDNESTRKRVANPREGNIVVMSGKDSSRDGDLVYIREDVPLKVTLDLSGITVGKDCVINLGARLFFIPEGG